MQGKYKVYVRNMEEPLAQVVRKGQSALILGPRQTGKTFLVKACLSGAKNLMEYPSSRPRSR